ncbi:hypothetical protein SDC9_106911 [bioreactor metagenome]|uniref:Uncharacterized protein n=1 Tax=bioreactor metagenome TaxID=1076179 RepID=A0A645BEC2_9ZZZZ
MYTTQQSRPGSPGPARNAFDGAGNSLATESPRCMCCRRPLSDPSSVRRGYGPRCFARLHLGQRLAMVESARQRLDHLVSLLPVLDGDQLESVDSALADLLAALGVIV